MRLAGSMFGIFGAAAMIAAPGSAHAQEGWSPRSSIQEPILRDAPGVLSPEAVRFAESALSASITSPQAFGAFSSAVVAQSEVHGGRIEISMFDPRFDGTPYARLSPVSPAERALFIPGYETRSSVAIDYVTDIVRLGSSDTLDIGLSPRAGFSFGPDGSAAGAGAQLRIGRYLDNATQAAWYIFAGADRHALLYDPADGFDMRRAVSFEHYAIVGDQQAGIALRMGAADLSFAYVRRVSEHNFGMDSYDRNEDFAAVSVSRRW